MGNARANENDRGIIEPADLPVTKGLQETIHDFREIDEELGMSPLLERIATVPLLDRPVSDETEARLPEIAGGVSLALARAFVILDPSLKNPQTVHWERAFRLFNLLLRSRLTGRSSIRATMPVR